MDYVTSRGGLCDKPFKFSFVRNIKSLFESAKLCDIDKKYKTK